MPAGRAGGTPTRNRSARRRDHSMFARFVRAAAKLRPAQHFRWCNDARMLADAIEIPASFRRSPEPQFRHDLSLMTPLGIEKLSDNRDHPLCLSQGRSTRSCSGAPQKHPSPADARSKIEGVALPPIDALHTTGRAPRVHSIPRTRGAAQFFWPVWIAMTRKRWFRVIALASFLILLGVAGTWYFLHRMVETARYIEPHAPGTYYFANVPRWRLGAVPAEGRDLEGGGSGPRHPCHRDL